MSQVPPAPARAGSISLQTHTNQAVAASGAVYVRLEDQTAASPPSKWSLMARAWRCVWPRDAIGLRIRFAVSIVLLLAGKILDLASPFAMKMVVDALTHRPDARFPTAGLVLFGTARVLSTALTEVRNIVYASVSANAERRIALEVFDHLQNLSLRYHVSRQTGSVLRSVSRGSSAFSDVMRTILFNIAPVFVQVVLVCGLLLQRYDWKFALVTFVTIGGYFVYTITTTQWRDKHRRDLTEKDNAFNQKAVDGLLNFETVKYFNAEAHELARFDGALKEFRDASIVSQRSLSVLNIGQNVIISVGVVLAMVMAARAIIDGDQSVGDFILISQFILTLYTPLGFLGTYWRMMFQSLVDIEGMLKILEQPIDVIEAPNPSQLVVRSAKVEFRDVRFEYDRDQPIIRGISFTVLPGQSVAIVGPSGAGKSTIGKLLYRFYDVSEGRILIDDQDIAACTLNSLRSTIGIVPQDCVLFNDSIGYNIGYGIKARTTRDATSDEIQAAATAASIHEFVMAQPERYETKCGERGLRMSGGERQRIAIARAILKDPPIMLYDEATSSLDTITEQAIQTSLDSMAHGRTVLIIAHRLSTIIHCDSIIVLQKGRIAEQGTHEQLLEQNGTYSDMWHRQQNQAELETSLALLTTPTEPQ